MPLATFFHLFLLSEQLHRQPRAVYKYCRASLSLRPLVPDSHLFAVLFGSTVDTIYVSLHRLQWEQRQIRTVFTVLVSGDSTDAVPGQGVLALRCATIGAGFCPDIPVVAQRQFPMVQLFMLIVQFSYKAAEVPVVVQRQVPQFRSCSSFTVVDTPVIAQCLIPMVLTIEISQIQFDKVVFVPVVQTVQFFLSSTSLPWRKGWFPWSCTLKTTEIPPAAVHEVVDVPVVLL